MREGLHRYQELEDPSPLWFLHLTPVWLRTCPKRVINKKQVNAYEGPSKFKVRTYTKGIGQPAMFPLLP